MLCVCVCVTLLTPSSPSPTVPFTGVYDVLETDYETYSSVYSCVNLIGDRRMEQAWVLARRSLTNQELELALSVFIHWGIDVETFVYTPQDDCSELP